MKKVIGIDLGTGFSAVAVMEGGKPIVIANKEGNRTTPSVVCIENKGKDVKVGGSAKRGMIMKPKNTVSFVKRFMGAEWNDPDVQKMLKMVTYDVIKKNNKPYIRIEGKDYPAEQISSYILADLKKVAEEYYGEGVEEAVITCPAWFNDVQRQATKLAGELAGLNVLRVINEPTAAILSSNIDLKGKDEKNVAVLDIGAGTTDVSIANISDGMVEVLASYGDVFLGGQNLDQTIIDWLAEEFEKDHSGVDLRKDPMALSRLAEAAEKAKIELSNSTSTEINLPYITAIEGVPQMLVKTLNRATFDNMIKTYVDRMCDCMTESIKKAKLTVDKIDEVLFVGGSCRVPLIETVVKERFKRPVDKGTNLDEAVALGAVIQANTLANPNEAKNQVLLLDVTPISLGIEVNGSMMHKLIEANTTIPCQKSEVFTTAVDNQPAVTIVVLQGERPMASDNKQIGVFNLDGIAPAKRGIPQIEVKFDIDSNGILSVSAMDKATNKEQHITIQNSNLSQEEIDKIKAEAEAHKEDDAKKKEDMDKKNNAEAYIYQVKNTLDDETLKDKFTEDDKKKITDLCDDLKKVIDENKVDEIDTKRKAIEDVFSPIMSKIYQEQAAQQQQATGQAQSNTESTSADQTQANDKAEDVQEA